MTAEGPSQVDGGGCRRPSFINHAISRRRMTQGGWKTRGDPEEKLFFIVGRRAQLDRLIYYRLTTLARRATTMTCRDGGRTFIKAPLVLSAWPGLPTLRAPCHCLMPPPTSRIPISIPSTHRKRASYLPLWN